MLRLTQRARIRYNVYESIGQVITVFSAGAVQVQGSMGITRALPTVMAELVLSTLLLIKWRMRGDVWWSISIL